MPVYTVHEPPLKAGEAVNPDRFVFVRDRFAFFAFLLTPLWLMIKRLWLVLLGYLALMLVVGVALHFGHVSDGGRFCVTLLIALLIGFEAPTLQRWTLARRKWKQIDTIVARNFEDAERRFFARWVARQSAPVSEVPPSPFSAPVINPPRSETLPFGLFPQPGARPR